MSGHVKPCYECDGAGEVPNGRGAGGNDPDSWMVLCDECAGKGYFPCEACGNPVHVEGYDCFVCDHMDHIERELTDAEIHWMVDAFENALCRASAWHKENAK